MAQTVKNLPVMWETRVQSLGWEDPLEKGMATHTSVLAWRIPWTEEPGGPESMGSQRAGHNGATSFTGVGDECDCLMASTFLSATLLGNWGEE